MEYIVVAYLWLESHPAIVTFVVMPMLAALFNYFKKPRSPEEFLAMNPYWRAFVQFMAAFFPDPQKMGKIAKELATGQPAVSRHDAEPKQ